MKIKVYELAFENKHGEFLDVMLYPEEGWISLSTDGKGTDFSVSSLEEWKEIDNQMREFFKSMEEEE